MLGYEGKEASSTSSVDHCISKGRNVKTVDWQLQTIAWQEVV
jgi:hypothetical protein